MEHDNFAQVINHYAKKLSATRVQNRVESGSDDDYKKGLRELTQEFYSVPATSIVVESSTHRAIPFWAIGEILTEVFAMNPPLMDKYKPEIIEWSYKLRPDRSAEYAYGRRWNEWNCLLNTVKTLSDRLDSKRAVIPIFTPYDTDPNRKDVPCTLLYDIKVRDDNLDLTTVFRSHDFMSGFKYDVFLSSFMNQMFCMMVNAETEQHIKPGRLYFYEGSLHSYLKDDDKLESIINSPVKHSSEFDIMHEYSSIKELYDDLLTLSRLEDSSYWGIFDVSEKKINKIQNPAFRDFARVYYNRNSKFHNKDYRQEYETKVLSW